LHSSCAKTFNCTIFVPALNSVSVNGWAEIGATAIGSIVLVGIIAIGGGVCDAGICVGIAVDEDVGDALNGMQPDKTKAIKNGI